MPDLRLTIELVPRDLWEQSIAKRYPNQWGDLRKIAVATADFRCELCGWQATSGKWLHTPNRGLEVHEIWEYTHDQTYGVQRLAGLVALCVNCHRCKHMGMWQKLMTPSDFASLVSHFLTVNTITEDQYQEHVAESLECWERNNSLIWSQNLSWFRDHPALANRCWTCNHLNRYHHSGYCAKCAALHDSLHVEACDYAPANEYDICPDLSCDGDGGHLTGPGCCLNCDDVQDDDDDDTDYYFSPSGEMYPVMERDEREVASWQQLR